jgi:hypothetical protein
MGSVPHEGHVKTRRRSRWRRVALLAAAVLASGITAAACGGPSSPGEVGPSADGSMPATGLLAYSACMRSHGVPSFPDPSSSGGIQKETSQQLGVSSSVLDAANNTCQHLIPGGQSLSGQASPTIPVAEQQYYLKAAACMRSHGITNFPEPSFYGGHVEFPELQQLVDINSPQFSEAYHSCQKLIPAGLPFAGPAG